MSDYYDNIDEFEGIEPIAYVMPFDVVRLLSHNNHSFHKRLYFYSPSTRVFYKYNAMKRTARRLKGVMKNDNATVRYRFIDDGDKNDEILLSRFFIKRIEGMKAIRLDKTIRETPLNE